MEDWTAHALAMKDTGGKPAFRLVAGKHKPDPVWWPRVNDQSQLYVKLTFRKATVEKRAALVSKQPLTLQIWENEADAPS